MTRSLLAGQSLTITSDKDFAELKEAFGSNAVKEICESIEVFDHNSQATLRFFWSTDKAIENAKNLFLEEFGANAIPAQVNVDRFKIIKDGEEFLFDFVEFMIEEGTYRHGTFYASNGDAVEIFNGDESIDSFCIDDCDSEEI